jgi:hypothetical protein
MTDTLYYDAEEGRYVSPDELSSGAYEPVPSAPEPSWGDVFSQMPYEAAASIVSPLGGAAKALGEWSDYEPLTQWGDEKRAQAQTAREMIRGELGLQPGSVKGYALDAASFIPLAAAGAVGGGVPLVALATGSQMADAYGNLRDRGVDVGRATTGASLEGAIGLPLNMIPYGSFAKPGRSFAGAVVRQMGLGGLTAPVQEFGNMAIESGVTGQAPDEQEFSQRLQDSLVMGTAGGAIMGPADYAGGKFRSRFSGKRTNPAAVDELYNQMQGPPIDQNQGLIQMAENPEITKKPYNPTSESNMIVDIPAESDPVVPFYRKGDSLRAQDAAPPDNGPIEIAGYSARTPEEQAAASQTLYELEYGMRQQGPDLSIDQAQPNPDAVIQQATGYSARSPRENERARQALARNESYEPTTPEDFFRPDEPIKVTGDPDPIDEQTIIPKPQPASEPVKAADQTESFPKAMGKEVSEPVDVAPAKEAPPRQEQSRLVDHSATQIEAKEIATRPDLMQFKMVDDTDTGTNKTDRIDGKFDHRKAGLLLLWEPKNPEEYGLAPGQRYIVANGHHRFELGSKQDVAAYNSQIVREADGYSANDARTLAAEINIADGKGTIYDQVKFLRGQAISRGKDEAMDRARSIGKGARKAQAIAFLAEDNLYTSFVAGRVTADQAEAIASGAPNNDDAQRAGIQTVIDEKGKITSEELKDTVEGIARELEDPGIEGEQGDMFGVKETGIAKARAESAAAHEMRRAVHERIYGLQGAAKKPEVLRAEGVPIDDPAALKTKLKDLAVEKAKWEEWRKHPDLKQQVADRVKGNDTPLFSKKKPSSGERGSFSWKPVKEKIDKTWTKEGIDEVADALGIKEGVETQDQLSRSEPFFRGHVPTLAKLGVDAKIQKAIAERYRQMAIFPRTVAQKFTNFVATFDAGMNLSRNRDRIATDLAETARPYLSLEDTTRVDAVLEAARKAGPRFQLTPESLATLKSGGKPLQPAEIEAIMSVRQTMDQALNVLKSSMMAKGQSIEDPAARATYERKVYETVEAMRSENYVPFARFGKKYVAAFDKNGISHFSLHENDASFNKMRAQLKKQGIDINTGELLTAPDGFYDELPPELTARFAKFDADAAKVFPPEGFSKHFAEAKLVPGYDRTQFKRGVAEYIQGLSNFAAKQRAQGEFLSARAQIDPKAEPSLYAYAKRYSKYMLGNDPEGSAVRQFLTHYYLGANIKSAAVNLTQNLTTTLPNLMIHTNNPVGALRSGMSKAVRFLSPKLKEGLAKEHPELVADIHAALADGSLTEQMYREIGGIAKGQSGLKRIKSKILDATMYMFDSAEKFNRMTSFISAWDVASKKGMTGAERFKFAENFANDTQFIYNKANRPEMARGKAAIFFTFRLFAGNMQRLLRNNLEPGRYKAAAGMLVALGTLGGAGAIPIFKELEKGFEASGVDPRKAARELLGYGKAGDAALYGVPSLAGVSLSGPLSTGELAPGIEQGVAPAIVRTVMGVAADPFQRIGKAAWLHGLGNDGQAVETLLPEALRPVSKAIRAYNNNAYTSAKRERIVKNPTAGELALTAAGFQPMRLVRAYEQTHSMQLADAEARDNGNINYKIASALADKDQARVKELQAEARRKGIKITPSAIRQQYLSILYPQLGAVKRAPLKARGEMLKTSKAYD